VHMASVWVPFTNQAKEAIADYDEIRKEFKLALQEAGRKLGSYLKKKQAAASQAKRRSVFNAYIEEVVKAYQSITKEDGDELRQALLVTARKKTELAEKLEAMKHRDPPEEMEGTLVIGPDGVPLVPGSTVVTEKDLADDSEPGIPASELVAGADADSAVDLDSLVPPKVPLESGTAKTKSQKADPHAAAPQTLSLFGEDDA